jgi:hypothetical protein
VYTKGLISESKVIPDAATDHRPVVTTVKAGGRCPGTTKLVSLKRRNFKAITRGELEGALNHTDWTRVYAIRDVDDILDFTTAGIVSASDRPETFSTEYSDENYRPNIRPKRIFGKCCRKRKKSYLVTFYFKAIFLRKFFFVDIVNVVCMYTQYVFVAHKSTGICNCHPRKKIPLQI